MTQPIFLVGIPNCRQWVILIVVEHRSLESARLPGQADQPSTHEGNRRAFHDIVSAGLPSLDKYSVIWYDYC